MYLNFKVKNHFFWHLSIKINQLILLETNFKANFENFDYLVFASSFAVEIFFKKVLSMPSNLQILGIGPSIEKALHKYNHKLVFKPKIFNLQNLGLELINKNLINKKKFLIVCGQKTMSAKLEQIIQTNHGQSERLIVYTQKMPKEIPIENLNSFLEAKSQNKLICLSSPEGFKNLLKIIQSQNLQFNSLISFLAIGETTQKEIQKYFPNHQIYTPKEYSYNGMSIFIKSYCQIE